MALKLYFGGGRKVFFFLVKRCIFLHSKAFGMKMSFVFAQGLLKANCVEVVFSTCFVYQLWRCCKQDIIWIKMNKHYNFM
jgi:hypothetical protein